MITFSSHPITALLLVVGIGLGIYQGMRHVPIPDVVGFLLYGVLIGPFFKILIVTPSSGITRFIVTWGALYILFEGGRHLNIGLFKKIWITVSLLATVGVVLTTLVITVTTHWVFGTPWVVSGLLAAVIANTDPATLIPVFARMPIEPLLQETAESEAAFNDAMASVLVMTLLGIIGSHHVDWGGIVFHFFRTIVVSAATSLALGYGALYLLSEKGFKAFPHSSPLVMLFIAIAAYQVSHFGGGSGFMAAFTTGILVGNGHVFHLPLASKTRREANIVNDNLSIFWRIMVFVLVGAELPLSSLLHYALPSLTVTVVLIAIARPLTVFFSMKTDRRAQWSIKQMLFMTWVRETGVISASLATLVASYHVPDAHLIQTVTFMTIFVTITLQASTTHLVARKLGVLLPEGPTKNP